ncbi:MAG: class I SAM-dependent methyltransferase [Deltaproteobacteria bacterium]
MSKFEKSRWADSEFSQGFRDDADIFLPFRDQFIEVSISFYDHFISHKSKAKVLDLGCGDGLFIQELCKSFRPAEVTLVDGSAEMLKAAQKRLSWQNGTYFIQAIFQQLLTDDPVNDNFDFIYSSLAIHHLPLEEKKKLYAYIYKHLSSGGWFIHYDVVLPPSEKLEKWYLSTWREWIKKHPCKERRDQLLGVPDQYKGNPDNMPDTLESQLEVLKTVGFCNVDCFYKYGLFSLFGGSK